MTLDRPVEHLLGLVQEFRTLTGEAEWVKFMANESEPREIGEFVSALANSAALAGESLAYIVWGISALNRAVGGTEFDPNVAKVGNEPLENWLLKRLEPTIHFRFFRLTVEGRSLVVLEIGRAFWEPVRFRGQEHIRVGFGKKLLKGYREKAWMLWNALDQTPFEERVAVERLRAEEVLRLLDYAVYFDLLEHRSPEHRDGILEALASDRLIQRCDGGGWNVTNLAAILLAKRLGDVRSLRKKVLQVVLYRGKSRVHTLAEHVCDKGYALVLKSLVESINALLPSNEAIGRAVRETVRPFPDLMVRELVTNALIHQDLSSAGAGPIVEIFKDRMEITNPGAPLVHTQRFIDCGPLSRNPSVASFMSRAGICGNRGSGWDKIVSRSEFYQLPAPLLDSAAGSTRAVLFAPRTSARMDKAERVRTIYWHACLRWVNHAFVTNASVRERFGMQARDTWRAAALIGEALRAAAIVRDDPEIGTQSKRNRYVPWWAKGSK